MKSFKNFIEFRNFKQKSKLYEVYLHKINDAFIILEKSRMKYRKFALFLSMCNLAMLITSLQYETQWVKRISNESLWSGLWDLCFLSKNVTLLGAHERVVDVDYYEHQMSVCHSKIEYIQKAVIGALLVAVASGLIGTLLSIAGFITHDLYKKYYYFHSAAEFFLISGITMLLTVIAYPLSVRHYLNPSENFVLGYGYYMCPGSASLYFVEFYIMMLDEFCPTPIIAGANISASTNCNVKTPTTSKSRGSTRPSVSYNKDVSKSSANEWV